MGGPQWIFSLNLRSEVPREMENKLCGIVGIHLHFKDDIASLKLQVARTVICRASDAECRY